MHSRVALALAIASLALPAAAGAQSHQAASAATPDLRLLAPTSSLAGTTSPHSATAASHDNRPEIALAGLVLIAAAGGVVRVRTRRARQVPA